MNISSLDAGIPLLTEVIPATDERVEEPEPVPTQPLAPSAAIAHASSTSPPAAFSAAAEHTHPLESDAESEIEMARWNDDDWNRLERKIRERILRQLLARTDTMLEERVRDCLADVLQTAVETLAKDIKTGLHRSVQDMISRAVSQEITRLQTTRK